MICHWTTRCCCVEVVHVVEGDQDRAHRMRQLSSKLRQPLINVWLVWPGSYKAWQYPTSYVLCLIYRWWRGDFICWAKADWLLKNFAQVSQTAIDPCRRQHNDLHCIDQMILHPGNHNIRRFKINIGSFDDYKKSIQGTIYLLCNHQSNMAMSD